ncbi:MAG: flavodoxin family protein [Deltaproteobacteria bacterium]|nr:flavodoxin family protein [Deltaproteobacteria bacterium]
MKKILGIIASPRKLGNSEIIIKEIAGLSGVDHELSLLRLNDFDIKPCLGCYQCLFRAEGCVLKDDFPLVVDAMAKADAWIVAAPTYVLGANASLKRLLDRGLGFYKRGRELWKKPAIGIAIAGMEGKEGYSKLNVDSFLRLFMSDVKASVIMYGALPGEILIPLENRRTAEILGKALFGEALPATGPVCPLCGGDTFRFMDDKKIRCMVCSNAGTFSVESGKPVFNIESSGHDLFLTEEDALTHKAWLSSMKERFLAHKDEMKAITRKFKNTGVWIRPPASSENPEE